MAPSDPFVDAYERCSADAEADYQAMGRHVREDDIVRCMRDALPDTAPGEIKRYVTASWDLLFGAGRIRASKDLPLFWSQLLSIRTYCTDVCAGDRPFGASPEAGDENCILDCMAIQTGKPRERIEQYSLASIVTRKLSPRNIPPADRISGIRGIEDQFADDVWDTYHARIEEILEPRAMPSMVHAAVDDAVASLESELTALAPAYMFEAYQAGSDSVYEPFEVTSADRDLLASVMEDSTGILPAITRFATEHGQALHEAVDRATTDGMFHPQTFNVERKRLEDLVWSRFKTFARTEITKAANWGKSVALEAIGRQQVEWVTAQDEGVCPICRELRDGSPYRMEEIIEKTNGTLSGHVGCRCGIREGTF